MTRAVVAAALAKLSPAEKASLTAGRDMWSTVGLPSIGLQSFKMADGPMGVASGRVDERDVSVLTPCPTALAATFDAALVERVGAVVGADAQARGVNALLAPNLNLPRSPLAGRSFETFSEDPYLTGLLGTAWITGLQSRGVGSIAKHLCANDSETQRHSMNSVVDERALHEVYLLPFEMAVEGGCVGVLTAYNRLNGAHCSENETLISIVKNDWKFDGPLVSDWFGTLDTLGCARGGLDLEMPGPARFLGAKFGDVVSNGEVAAKRLDDAAARVLAGAARLGKLEGGDALKESRAAIDARETLTEAAAAGFVLLKNEGLLPLAPGAAKRIAVIGPNASAPCYQGGTFAKIAVTPEAKTPLEALRAMYGDAIVFEPGVDSQARLPRLPVTPARDVSDGATRGMTIDYFEGHAFETPGFSETRDTNMLTWFAGMHTASDFSKAGGVRASGVYTPAQAGPHTFYVGGTGSVRLSIDGKEVFRRDADIKAADIMGALRSGDAESVVVELSGPTRVEAELRYNPARAQGFWYGVRGPDAPDAMFARAIEAARRADAVFLFVGETSDASVESKDRTSTAIAAEQIALVEAVCAANPRTVVIANVGHAFDANFASAAGAFLVAWYPGQEFGPAIADVLAGEREPGGRLPVTFAARDADYAAFDLTPDAKGDLVYSEGRLIGYRSFAMRRIAPLHALGEGFGYARFEWENVTHRIVGDAVEIEAVVRNVSARAGKEVVQAYVTLDGAPALKGVAALHVKAGETAQARITLPKRAFDIWDGGWRRARGAISVQVGPSLSDARHTFRIEA